MAGAGSLLFSRELGIHNSFILHNNQPKGTIGKGHSNLFAASLSSHASLREGWSLHLLQNVRGPLRPIPSRPNLFVCHSLVSPNGGNDMHVLKTAAEVLTRSFEAFHGRPLVIQLVPAVGIIAFAAWGLRPLIRLSRALFLQESDSSWNKSTSKQMVTSYLQPLMLWGGALLICRALDPIILPSTSSQAVKLRLVNFVRSLSTVLAFAYCLSSLIRQTQKFFVQTKDSSDARNMGYDFAGKAVYSAVWVASLSLFMELLGFSTQKWLTAGGLGTVLLTLAGREIFTNFLSSVMIHATRPFVLNEWIQTKIDGYEVSGTVEHVGWWSPTIIRGDDREAIHIPNHKFTVNVVRNLTQKIHWRIKTHLAISHLDVDKINNIVADMRKVLSKNPQVEQQKLHRRVFLDNVEHENQALLIMVSCFVKTSHFEEYLCVKEAILLDLLRVIRHHGARLATPIRTVQRIYRDAEAESIPFSDTFYNRSRAAANRQFLLIEPSYKINGEEKTKPSSKTAANSEESDANAEAQVTTANSTADMKVNDDVTSPSTTKQNSGVKTSNVSNSSSVQNNSDKSTVNTEAETNANNQENEKPVTPSRSALEDNIVLGVALEGSKRVLPIEDEVGPSPPSHEESKEFAGCLNGGGSPTSVGKDKKEDQASSSAGATPIEQREQENR